VLVAVGGVLDQLLLGLLKTLGLSFPGFDQGPLCLIYILDRGRLGARPSPDLRGLRRGGGSLLSDHIVVKLPRSHILLRGSRAFLARGVSDGFGVGHGAETTPQAVLQRSDC
jgi:hypothetical protein